MSYDISPLTDLTLYQIKAPDKALLILREGPTLVGLVADHLPRLLPNTITRGVRALVHEFWGAAKVRPQHPGEDLLFHILVAVDELTSLQPVGLRASAFSWFWKNLGFASGVGLLNGTCFPTTARERVC